MGIQKIIMSFIVFCVMTISGFVNLNTCNTHFIKQKKKQFCYISFVRADGTLFLVKQKRKISDLLAVVFDVLAAHIAEHLNIAHQVKLIPAFKKFPGKIYDDWPATIHTLASGSTINGKRSVYKKMNIKQACLGLRREMIEWMARHKQLVKIVALDIFLCNHDRHRGNLFYNAKTDSFCAIDMDLLYEYNLPLYAHQNLQRMAEYDLFPLTVKEFFALFELRKTLEFLVRTFSADDIHALFDQLIDQAGITDHAFLQTKRTMARIDVTRRMISQSYKDTIVLIKVLGDIIKQGLDEMPGLRCFQEIEDFEKQYEQAACITR